MELCITSVNNSFAPFQVNVLKSTTVRALRKLVAEKLSEQSEKLDPSCLELLKIQVMLVACGKPGEIDEFSLCDYRVRGSGQAAGREVPKRAQKRPLEEFSVVLQDVKRVKVEPELKLEESQENDLWALDNLDEEWRPYCAPPNCSYTPQPLSDEQIEDDTEFLETFPALCPECVKEPRRDCSYCGCLRCHRKVDDARMFTCGGYLDDSDNEQTQCARAVHASCLNPPVVEPFSDEQDLPEWYCWECHGKRLRQNEGVVTGGGKVQRGKKAASLKAATTTRKNWGGGYSTASLGLDKRADRNKTRRGPIPGVQVGQTFYNRKVGNYSLAVACAARPIDPDGADAGDKWHKGEVVRVVRGFNKKITPRNRKQTMERNPDHFKYEPKEGLRYDGLYKVVKYWLQKRPKEGTSVYQFLLRRCDKEPAPWTEEGKKISASLPMILPKEGDAKDKIKENKENETGDESGDEKLDKRKKKQVSLPDETLAAIQKDERNNVLWAGCLQNSQDYAEFTEKVSQEFGCIICTEVPDGNSCRAMQLNCCEKVFCTGCVHRWSGELKSKQKMGNELPDLCPQRCNEDKMALKMNAESTGIDEIVSACLFSSRYFLSPGFWDLGF